MPALQLRDILGLSPGQRKGRIKFTTERKAEFLKLLAEKGLVTHAAHAVGVTMRTIGRHRKADEAFALAYVEAQGSYCDSITDEVRRRAVEGVPKGVYYQGIKVDQEVIYSDKLLEMLAKRYIPEFRDSLQADINVRGGVLVVGAVATTAEEWQTAFGGERLPMTEPEPKKVENTAPGGAPAAVRGA